MRLKRIVVATDFSEISLAAVERAFDLASAGGAKVDILFVREPPVGMSPLDLPLITELDEEVPPDRFTRLIPEGMQKRTTATVLDGVAAHRIAAFASEVGADLIVVGTHGRKGLSRLLLGSTAEALVREAPCDVLVARQPVSRQSEARETALAETVGSGLKGGDPLC